MLWQVVHLKSIGITTICAIGWLSSTVIAAERNIHFNSKAIVQGTQLFGTDLSGRLWAMLVFAGQFPVAKDISKRLLEVGDVTPFSPRDASVVQFLFKVFEIGIN